MLQLLNFTIKLLIILFITARRQLIHNRTASKTTWNKSYDFIIVGAGAAGCVVAKRLASSGNVSVLLLEAGGAQDAIYSDMPGLFKSSWTKRPYLQWHYLTEPQKYAGQAYAEGRIPLMMGKTLGGSSTHNDMVFNRGNPRDYDLWEHKFGARGWSFKDVLPFFKRFENNKDPHIVAMSPGWHGTDGRVQVTSPRQPGENLLKLKAVYNSLGFEDTDINGPQQLGTMIGQSFIGPNGIRSSSSNSYIDPNPYPNNLHIVTKALVTKILFNGLTAVGVEFVKNDKPFIVYARKEVIISAGAISTPQILMLSGVGPEENLTKVGVPVLLDLPVGENFKNHLGFNPNLPFGPSLTEKNLEMLYLKSEGPLSEHPHVDIFFNTKNNPDPQWPNMFIWSVLNAKNKIDLSMVLALPKSRGTVRLHTNSPFDPPLIDPNFLADDQDYATAIEATQFIFYFSAKPLIAGNVSLATLKSIGCPTCQGLPDYQCIEGIKCYIQIMTLTMSHPMGTCRMGDVFRNDVVVDPYLQVKNTKNLRVCDNSIMPEMPNGNLYAPALMIGEKCAQMIKDNYHL